jgi:hypothetical protein
MGESTHYNPIFWFVQGFTHESVEFVRGMHDDCHPPIWREIGLIDGWSVVSLRLFERDTLNERPCSVAHIPSFGLVCIVDS